MRLVAFAIVILAGGVALTENNDVGTTLIFVGAFLGVLELFACGFVKEVLNLGAGKDSRKPPTKE